MKRILVAVALVLLFAVPGGAQTPASPDFYLRGYVDMVISATGSTTLSRNAGQLVSVGWLFECRSGLQPVTQRVGAAVVYYTNDAGERFTPTHFQIITTVRPDVEAYWQRIGACPAIGPNVGFAAYADAPGPGFWIMHVTVATWDGAGRTIQTDYPSQRVLVQF
jgi:hypothetical protein